MYNTDELDLCYNCLLDRTLDNERPVLPCVQKCQREDNSATVHVNSHDSEKQALIVVGNHLNHIVLKM
jgi:hypothetical protein